MVYQLTCNVEAEDFDARVVQQDPMVRGKVQAAWIKNYLDENPGEELNVCSLMGAPNGGSNGYKGWKTVYEEEAYQGRVSEIIATDANWSRANALSLIHILLPAASHFAPFPPDNPIQPRPLCVGCVPRRSGN